MDKITNYLRESYLELTTKVSWPTWFELQSSAIVVAVTSLIIALLVSGMDEVAKLTLTTFYKAF